MNNLFKELIDLLNKEFKKFDLNESVQLSLSKMPEFDMQINNLVKHNKADFFKHLQKNIIEIIDSTNLFQAVEENELGFLNLVFNHTVLIKNLTNKKSDFSNDIAQKIIFDYGGPNIGKPLHVGHMRTLNIGRSLYNMHSFINNEVISDIHLGDWGMPVAQIISYLEKENIDPESIDSNQLEVIYPKASEEYKQNENFKIRAQEINKLLNNKDNNMLNVWKIIKNTSVESLEKDFKILNHRFDFWLGESDVNDLIPGMIDDLVKNKKVIKDKGALISAEDVDPKVLITKSDGSYLYITTDLATILYRQKNIPYDKAFYIVDNRQSLHFKQLFDSIKFFEFNDLYHEHISYGTLNDSDGNPFKTRQGGTKQLSELFGETYDYIKNINTKLSDSTITHLTNSVLTFSDLITNRKTDYKFDLEKFTNVNGKTGIYVQYAQVRAKKLLETLIKDKRIIKNPAAELNPLDRKLVISLANIEFYLDLSLKNSEPHHLANYLYEISNGFNSFYQDSNIKNIKDIDEKNQKIFITSLFIKYSHFVMSCLGIKPVEKM